MWLSAPPTCYPSPAMLESCRWRSPLKLGMEGEDVRAWQTHLRIEGYAIASDGIFGKRTHNATCSWQRDHRLEVDGVVGPKTRAKIGTLAPAFLRAPLNHRAVPYCEAANWSWHVVSTPKRWIVLHSMEAPEASTTAHNVAEWFAGKFGPAPEASAHYCVDDANVICTVEPDRVAWHAPGANRYGIGIEHAGYARQSRAEWNDSFSRRMLDLSATLAAQLCRRFSIPPRLVDPGGLKRDEPGITTHAIVGEAWGRTDHTDPGEGFPLASYVARVRERMC